MYRNKGIDYRFPRSSGGRFFSQRVDEGRSLLSVVFTGEPVVSVNTGPTDVLYEWPQTDLSVFQNGFGIGNFTGSITVSRLVNTGTIAGSVEGFTTNTRTFPRARFDFSADFITPASGGLYLFPLEMSQALPARYRVYIQGRVQDTVSRAPVVCLVFGATQVTGTATGSFYGNVLAIGGEQAANAYRAANIQTGGLGLFRSSDSPSIASFSTYPEYVRLIYDIELKSTTGDTSGSVWTAKDSGRFENGAVPDYLNPTNHSTSSYSSWETAGKLDRLYLGFYKTGAGSGDFVEIESFAILKHPLEDD